MAQDGRDGKRTNLTVSAHEIRLEQSKPRQSHEYECAIPDEQMEKIRAISAQTGISEAELVRHGIDLMIAEKQPQSGDWRDAARGIYGMWKDREDLDDIFQSFRQDFEDRHKKLFPDG